MNLIQRLKKKLGRHFYRGGFFHPTANYSRVLDRYRSLKDKKIINIGSGGYDPVPGAINIDPYREGPNTIKAFGEKLPFVEESIDVAFSGGVLEHVKEPKKIVDEVYRVLKYGGEIYVEVPMLAPYHAAPEDYYRWTISGLRELCGRFEEVETGVTSGPGSALAWILMEFVQIVPTSKFFRFVFKNLAKIVLSPLKYFDRFLLKRDNVFHVVGGIYFLGRKVKEDI